VDYHDPSSLLFQNISALVPSTISNPPSITKYLGVKDWYTIHYYTTCSGFFAPSTSNPSLLSTTKINTTCMLQGSGNVFSLGSTLEKEIKPSVRLLADEVASKVKSYNISPPINLWLTGISTCFVIILNLPCSFSGRWRHANSRNFVVAVVSSISSYGDSFISSPSPFPPQHSR
jgi:hypothetical protein